MHATIDVLCSPLAQRTGWALVHFLWQGTAVALLLALTLSLLRNRSAQARWIASCAALALMALLPGITAWMISVEVPHHPQQTSAIEVVNAAPAPVTPARAAEPARVSEPVLVPVPAITPSEPTEVKTAAPHSPVEPSQPAAVPWPHRLEQAIQPTLPWAIVAWFVGVLAMSVWHLGGWFQVQRLKRLGTRPVEAALQQTFDRLLQRLQIRRPVQLLESLRVAVPVVVGWLRPVILLPVGALAGLTPSQVEAILVHELAHIRRWDCLVQIFQVVIETLLFYHPAVWWVSRQLRQQSEQSCDDLAVGVCGDRRGYACALAQVAEFGTRRPALAVAVTGGKLLPRIRRLLGVEAPVAWPLGRCLSGVLALATIVAVGIATGVSNSSQAQPQANLAGSPATQLATRSIVSQDQLRARLWSFFCNSSGELIIARPIAEDWTDALQKLVAERTAHGERSPTGSQVSALGIGVQRYFYLPFPSVSLTMHPLRYALVRRQMLKRVSDYLDRYDDEAVTRPQAQAQIRELMDGWCADLVGVYPAHAQEIKDAAGKTLADIFQISDDPFQDSYKRRAIAADLTSFRNEWTGENGGTGLLPRIRSRMDSNPPDPADLNPMRSMLLLHGYWNRVSIPNPPDLTAAEKAVKEKESEIAQYEAEQAKEASYSRSEQYTPALPLPFAKRLPAPPDSWGELAHGIQVQLYAERAIFDEGAPVALEYQIRNRSDAPVPFRSDRPGHQIDLDGVRYINQSLNMSDGLSLDGGDPIRPDHRSVFRPITLNSLWTNAQHQALTLPPGQHKVRFIYLPQARFSIDAPTVGDPANEVISNTLTLTVRAVAAAHTTTQPAASGVPGTQPSADAAEIDRLIKQFGSDSFAEREEAQKALVKIGLPAVAALQNSTTSRDPEVGIRCEATLKQIEEVSWGQAVEGLQVRLRPLRSVWKSGKTPVVTLDLWNTGDKKINYLGVPSMECQLLIDDKWYGWSAPSEAISMLGSTLDPSQKTLDRVSVELNDKWARPRQGERPRRAPGIADAWGEHLKLTPGKHTVQVLFTAGGPKQIEALSNPVLIEVEDQAGAIPGTQPAVNPASRPLLTPWINIAPARETIAVLKDLRVLYFGLNHGMDAGKSGEWEIRTADQRMVARFPYNLTIAKEPVPGVETIRSGFGDLNEDQLRQMGSLPDGEYLLAWHVGGKRLSNVMRFWIKKDFDARREPLLKLVEIERAPGQDLPLLLIRAYRHALLDPAPLASEVAWATLNIDGRDCFIGMRKWAGTDQPLAVGACYAYLLRPSDYGQQSEPVIHPGTKHVIFAKAGPEEEARGQGPLPRASRPELESRPPCPTLKSEPITLSFDCPLSLAWDRASASRSNTRAATSGTQPAGTQPSIQAAEIDRLIQQLGSDKFTERESAQKALEQIGEPAVAALQQAVRDADAERSSRSVDILKTIDDRQWGPLVEGVQARLRLESEIWRADQIPELQVDVRNENGRAFLAIVEGQRNCQLEIDGQWYQWPLGMRGGRHLPLDLGKSVSGTVVTLSPIWREATEDEMRWREDGFNLIPEDRRILQLAPGRHAVRVGFTIVPTRANTGPGFHVISNSVGLDVLARAGKTTASWPASVELTGAVIALHQANILMVNTVFHEKADRGQPAITRTIEAADAVERLADKTPLLLPARSYHEALLKFQGDVKDDRLSTEASAPLWKALGQLVTTLTGEALNVPADQPGPATTQSAR